LELDKAAAANYSSEPPDDKWLNILGFQVVPFPQTPESVATMNLVFFHINSGELWNGLAGSLGTPTITPLDGVSGEGRWTLFYPGPPLAFGIADYPTRGVITATDTPEPAPVCLIATVLLTLPIFRQARRKQASTGRNYSR
jgi:hypothetical protein